MAPKKTTARKTLVARKKLTIDQALRRVSRIKGELVLWQKRLATSIIYEKGKEPAFTYAQCTAKVKPLRDELVDLSSRIAEGNAKARIKDGARTITLCRALRLIAELKGEISSYRALLDSACAHDMSNEYGASQGIRKKKQTALKREGMEIKTVTDDKGRKRPERVPKMEEYTVVSEVTISEATGKLEVAQETFDALNALVNTANHTTVV